jgi:hypothetical protein
VDWRIDGAVCLPSGVQVTLKFGGADKEQNRVLFADESIRAYTKRKQRRRFYLYATEKQIHARAPIDH